MIDSQTKASPRRDWIAHTPKWVLLSIFWMMQGAVLYFVQAFVYLSQSDVGVDSEENDVISKIFRDGFFGRLPSFENYLDLLTNSEFYIPMLGVIAALTIAQMIFLLPVRQPGLTGAHGRSIKKSLMIASTTIGILTLAVLLGIAGFFEDVFDMDLDSYLSFPGEPYTTFGATIIFGWLIATPLLIRFTKPGRKEDVLARVSKKLFIGTIIEVALLIPLDVMVRRKTSCYCWAGTYWALTICGFVGVFALGPAVFLPILSKRRKAWYGGHCGVCGYDMTGMLKAPRCPECGTGWRFEAANPPIDAQ